MTTSLIRESNFESELYSVPSKVLVVIDRPWKSIGPEERTLLQKILAAIQLNINGVIVVQENQLNITLISPGQRVISFGWNPEKLPLFEQQAFGAGWIVFSESLDQLNQRDESKKRLWQGLKKLFTA